MAWADGVWTDYPNPAGNGTFTDIMAYNNQITGDVFGIMLLAGIFMLIFIVGSSRDPDSALASSAFVCTILSYILVAMGILANWVSISMTFILVVSVILLYNKGGNSNV